MFEISRQAYHKRQKTTIKQSLQQSILLQVVRDIRKTQPRVGGRKLYHMLNQQGFTCGRDELFKLLKENQLLVKPIKKYTRTTQSYHRFRKYPNLIKDLVVSRPNQVYVSDITYIKTLEGFCYLALITDVYSRKIVGYDLSRSLAIEGCQRALNMALKSLPDTQPLIHHSDRGIQYCSDGYVRILHNKQIQISMTEENHVYENALAERVNGILKTEFMLGEKLQSFNVAKELVEQSIQIYNEQRLHTSLNFQTPEQRYAA
jgi:transposase InsO family protein